MKLRPALASIIVVAALCLLQPSVQAGPGDLDPSFGGFAVAGKTSGGRIMVRAMLLLPDGKFLTSGSRGGTFAVARHHRDGSLDTGFGTNGIATTTIVSAQTEARANAMALQQDGKIVLAGYVEHSGSVDFAVARFNPDGTLDRTFHGDGTVHSDFDDERDLAFAVAIQADGKIVVAGAAWDRESAALDDFDFGVARFNPDGTLDTSFAGNGKIVIGFGNHDGARAIAIQDDAKILLAGFHCDPDGGFLCAPAPPDGVASSDYDFALARLNPNGSLDSSFSGDGRVTAGFGGGETALALALQSDGRIVAVGGGDRWAIARFHPNGSLDSSLDGDGKLTTAMPGMPAAHAVVIQNDGKIVAAGTDDSQRFILARYRFDGTLDNLFAGNGKLATDFGDFGNEVAYALALQPDGRLIAAGNLYMARYFPDGSLDAGGRQTLAFNVYADDERAYAVAVQPDNKIVTVGVVEETTDQFALARFQPDGSLDTSFDGDGRLTFGFGGDERARAVALQRDDKIVVAGSVSSPSAGHNFMLTRFGPDGSFDCFNIIDFAGFNDVAAAVAIAPDQSILVAGQVRSAQGNYVLGVARFQANCAIDRTFGADGKVQLNLGSGVGAARAVLVQESGKIVLAGTHSGNVVLVRLTTGGALDHTFGDAGVTVTDFASSAGAYALAEQPDGKLVIAGSVDNDFLLARYDADGLLDTSFSGNGIVQIDFAGYVDRAYGLDVRADGTIVAAGCSSTIIGNTGRFALVQLDSTGDLDYIFGGDGKVLTGFGTRRACAQGVAFAATNRVVAVGYQDADTQNMALARYQTSEQGPGLVVPRSYLPLIAR